MDGMVFTARKVNKTKTQSNHYMEAPSVLSKGKVVLFKILHTHMALSFLNIHGRNKKGRFNWVE